MNRWIALSSLLSFVTASVHIFMGGPEVHDAILSTDLPILLKTYVSVLWHATTCVLLLNSIALGIAAFSKSHRTALVWGVVLQYMSYALLFVGYSLANLGSILNTPQWIAFFLISALALLGIRRKGLM